MKFCNSRKEKYVNEALLDLVELQNPMIYFFTKNVQWIILKT